MRKKLKELLHKEEGFTLVELLAVIVILGIIVAIAVPAIGGVTDRARTGATEAEQELVIDAAKLYAVNNKVKEDDTVSVKELIDNGYLEALNDDSSLAETNGVAIEVSNNGDSDSGLTTYTYKFVTAAGEG